MAEILGSAAAALQLAEAARNLKRIYGAVKDAPTDLSELVSEVSISVEQYKRSRNYLKKALLLDDSLVSDCIRRLEQAVIKIKTVIEEIQVKLRSSKTIGSITFVLNSRRIQEMKQKLKDAQQLMDRTERSIHQTHLENAM